MDEFCLSLSEKESQKASLGLYIGILKAIANKEM